MTVHFRLVTSHLSYLDLVRGSPIQVKIIDDDGVELKPNEIGEICLLSPDRVRGYLGKPDLDWFHTGDLGSLGTCQKYISI